MKCPNCGSSCIHKSRSTAFVPLDRLVLVPARCYFCSRRFRVVFGWLLTEYAPPQTSKPGRSAARAESGQRLVLSAK
jgi:hypothetical protein